MTSIKAKKANKQTLFSSGDYITHKSDEWAVFKAIAGGKHLYSSKPAAVRSSETGGPVEAGPPKHGSPPCTYLAACCSCFARGCVPIPSCIRWSHDLSLGVAFLIALLQGMELLCQALGLWRTAIQPVLPASVQQHGQQGSCVLYWEKVGTVEEDAFPDPVYSHSAPYIVLESHMGSESEWQSRISLPKSSGKTCVNQYLLGSCYGDFP